MAETGPTDDHLAPDGPGDGGPLGAPLPGLARGLPPDRPARPLQLLRGVHPHHRLDVQPARQVAEDDARDPVAAPDRVAQLPADEPRLAPGPQRLQPPGPGLHRPRREQEGGGHPGLPAAGREHAAVGRRPLPAQPQLRQRHRRRQAARAELPVDGRGRPPLHARASGSGSGRATTTASPTSSWPAAATSRRSRRSPRSTSSASTCPTSASASSTSSTSCGSRPTTEHPHGLSDREFDALFTTDRPIIFAYHGYPWLIHRLTYRRTNHANLHVRGYKEEGTVTTPFDMVMRNDLDRFHLVMDVIDRVPGLGSRAAALRQQMVDERVAGAGLRPRVRRGPGRDPRLDVAALSGGRVRVLVLNAGSSSLKAAVLDPPSVNPSRRRRSTGAPTRPGPPAGPRRWRGSSTALPATGSRPRRSTPSATASSTAGHASPADRVDDEVVAAIAELATSRRSTIDRRRDDPRRAGTRCRTFPHVASFDTAFHASLPSRRLSLSGARGLVPRLGRPAVRLPRPVGRVVGRSRGGAARATRSTGSGSSSPISAAAAPSPRSTAVDRSTRRWA